MKAKTKTKTDRVMPSAEREELLSQIESEKAFQASIGTNLGDDGRARPFSGDELTVDKAKISRRIGTLSKAVREQESAPLRGAARNAAVARHKHLQEQLPQLLMTKFDQDQFPRHGHDYSRAVERAKKEIGDPSVKAAIGEYRALGRTLYPEDPSMSSTERLRKLR